MWYKLRWQKKRLSEVSWLNHVIQSDTGLTQTRQEWQESTIWSSSIGRSGTVITVTTGRLLLCSSTMCIYTSSFFKTWKKKIWGQTVLLRSFYFHAFIFLQQEYLVVFRIMSQIVLILACPNLKKMNAHCNKRQPEHNNDLSFWHHPLQNNLVKIPEHNDKTHHA